MLPINRQVLNLDVIYSYMSQQETWKLGLVLRAKRMDLEDLLDIIEEREIFDGHYEEEKEAVEAQLICLNDNISTVTEALLKHEIKIFESRPMLNDLQFFGLN